MKIYTKKGDKGKTDCGGRWVNKNCVEVEVLGDIDELNSLLGMVRVNKRVSKKCGLEILAVQQDLMEIGSVVGGGESKGDLGKYVEKRRGELEKQIDKMEEKLPKLTHFIVPGGNNISARLQVARAVCRRCERHLIKAEVGQGRQEIQAYLNRLSDWLFVKARWVARDEIEMKWRSRIGEQVNRDRDFQCNRFD